ncbi:MAG: Ig-like domain-containing protein [Patescibacteria group bacterium]
MRKIVLLLILFIAISPFGANAGDNPVIVSQTDYPEYFYANTFDNLVLNFAIYLVGPSVLNSLTIENIGTSRDGYEINRLVLWADDGNGKFDGFAKDTEIGYSSSYESTNNNWVFTNLNYKVAGLENRFFVSLETLNKGTTGRIYGFALPAYSDANKNKTYDSGDKGLFFSTSEALPYSKFTNDDSNKYKIVTGDPWTPVIVMTNLKAGQIITDSSFTIKGKAKDQGGSLPDVIQVCVDTLCKTATGTENWEYSWTNITEGSHTVYATAKDFNGNIGQTETITVHAKKTVATFSKEKSTVVLDKTVITADGVDYLKVDVTVKNSDNEAIVNKIIFLNEVTDKSGAVVIKSKTTDVKGQVSFKARSTVPGIKTLTITTEDGDTLKDKFTVEYIKIVEDIDYTSGRWIKLADQTAVYFLDKNNTRHAYPTSAVWESYFGKDFSKVEKVSGAEMSSYGLGRNVPFKTGSLMKIPSVDKVYFVSQNAKISWVTSSDLAKSMFGTDWTKKVKDLPESFFTDYLSGNKIE